MRPLWILHQHVEELLRNVSKTLSTFLCKRLFLKVPVCSVVLGGSSLWKPAARSTGRRLFQHWRNKRRGKRTEETKVRDDRPPFHLQTREVSQVLCSDDVRLPLSEEWRGNAALPRSTLLLNVSESVSPVQAVNISARPKRPTGQLVLNHWVLLLQLLHSESSFVLLGQ